MTRYTLLQRLIHWAVAVIAVCVLAAGLILGILGFDGLKNGYGIEVTNFVYKYHKTFGVVLLVLGLATAVSLTKGLICAGVGRAFGYRNVVPLALGLTMFQAGEFAFVIGRVGVATQSIGADLYSGIMAVTLVTMFLPPFVSRATAPIYALIRRRRPVERRHRRQRKVQLDDQ